MIELDGYDALMQKTVIVLPDVSAIVQRAATIVVERIRSAIQDRGKCTLALSGGTSVGNVFELLALIDGIDWSKVYLFWGDERFIDASSPYSSYRLADEKLLGNVPSLPRGNVFPVPVNAATPLQGAKAYSETIRAFFQLGENQWPRFDLAINGMGPDGHTGSLFPGSAALESMADIAVMNHAGLTPWIDRITLTFPVFNHARCILFMASGEGKAQTLKAVLEGERNVREHPAQGIAPMDGEVIWLLDPPISRLLSQKSLAEREPDWSGPSKKEPARRGGVQ